MSRARWVHQVSTGGVTPSPRRRTWLCRLGGALSSGVSSAPGIGSTARRNAVPPSCSPLEERSRPSPAPGGRYDVPLSVYSAKVHRDHHIEVAKALALDFGNLIGQRVEVRADRQLVRIYWRGQLVKTHPRQPPGRRSHRPRRPARRHRRLRAARHRAPQADRRRTRPSDRDLRHGVVGHPVAVDQDAPGLRPVGACQGSGPRNGSVPPASERWRPKRSTSG